MTETSISIVIPVLNDVVSLRILLPQLQNLRALGHEIIIVDGGSVDGSIPFARLQVDRVLMTGTGRGRQMNLGAEDARHNILLFLHADSIFPETGITSIVNALSGSAKCWGRFDVQFDQPGMAYTVIATMMNLRSRITGVATGDQAIFVYKKDFHEVGGYQAIPLMEDIALSKVLRKKTRPECLSNKIITSGRRWAEQGVVKTVLLMWYIRFAYFCGVDAEILARLYYPSLEVNSAQSESEND